jgi:SAM-dependent methyltransferase
MLKRYSYTGGSRLRVHQEVLQRKPILQRVFRDFHQLLFHLDQLYFGDTPGRRVELGAGVAPARDVVPELVVSDVVWAPHLDLVADAQRLPFPRSSVRSVYCQNAFHHFPNPRAFFAELERVLVPGGGAIMIEPYYGLFATFLYPRLFAEEGFDKEASQWGHVARGPMEGTNQAQSYIIFFRDRKQFEIEFPALELVHTQPLTNYLRYLFSGGLNFPALVPSFVEPVLRAVEWLLQPLGWVFALHHVVVLRKKGDVRVS